MIADPHEIQRLRYAPGQDLLSRDFRDQEAFESQLRWWHNRAEHGAFGVRDGLAVTSTGASLEVDPGLAYDAFGRELILPGPGPQKLTPPASPENPVFLVIRYREEERSPSPGELAGVCPGGLPPRGAALAWVPADRFRPTDGVPLARVPDDGGTKFHPPLARPLARPRLGRGSTVQGATAWKRWDLGRSFFGLKVEIDTRAAGFTQLPCYFAWVQGGVETRTGKDQPPFLLPLFPHVLDATLTGFTLGVLTFSFGESTDISKNRKQIVSSAQAELSVCWLGVQMQSERESSPEVIHGNS